MRYEHRFRVNAPVAAVADFHSSASSLGAITPPPLIIRVIGPGAPRRRRHHGFYDVGRASSHSLGCPHRRGVSLRFCRQADRGAVQALAASAHLRPADEQTTEVIDEVEAELRLHPWWGPIGMSMWAGLPALFAYRQQQTSRILKNWRNNGP